MRYETTVAPPRWLNSLMFVVFVACLVGAVFAWLQEGPVWGKLIATGVALVMLPLVDVRGRITVDDEELTLAVGMWFRKRIPLTEITSVELTRAAPMDFGGYGYRSLAGGEAGFLFAAGPAAKVRATEGRSVVIGAPDADRLVEVLGGRQAPKDP
ncbi:hypothetical protein SacazDRAFT_03322 [Saccharomonospora azurea NA-128]|uniref:Bacterial Pleckstrin homology domain-containing protein n=2 Tax=Saccharomonospora azurea TaxID=40988 RepID=H8G4Y2_9PSEU|nr:hypothetical protein SZMC14600_06016 [Saccharomonospora azurea SZMC 14600]EHY90199.1 hypothetical protein SacazDRAFT_03322 [Saccharomonospora azurea NA-128]